MSDTETGPSTRTRERNPVIAKLIQRFEGMIAAAEHTAEERQSIIRSLQFEMRGLLRRLSRYEVEPPVFPLPVMDQIKKLRHFGLPVHELASIYRTSAARIERVLSDEEVPLIMRHPKTPPDTGRAIRV